MCMYKWKLRVITMDNNDSIIYEIINMYGENNVKIETKRDMVIHVYVNEGVMSEIDKELPVLCSDDVLENYNFE